MEETWGIQSVNMRTLRLQQHGLHNLVHKHQSFGSELQSAKITVVRAALPSISNDVFLFKRRLQDQAQLKGVHWRQQRRQLL